MPAMENNELVFRFPQIEENARFSIDFQRTLRIPDTDRTYPLPPGLGAFPLRHAEDYRAKLDQATTERGGVILPIWQAEAMWLNFSNRGPEPGLDFPVAIKVAAGKINAVTGETWRNGLHNRPQDYMVSPEQPWLDGFAIGKGVIRQFVAMPLGDGYSVEEQLSGQAEWGGLQISVVPLKSHVWKSKREVWARSLATSGQTFIANDGPFSDLPVVFESRMAMAAGGRMRQVIHRDPFDAEDWDIAAADRVFVTMLHAKDWESTTGTIPPNHPPTAYHYNKAGLPWFDHYGRDQQALPGSKALAGVKSVGKLFKSFTGAALPNSADVETEASIAVGPGAKTGRVVRTDEAWDR